MSSRAGTRVRKPKASPIRSRAVPLFTTPVFPGASVPRPAVPVQNSIASHNFAEIPLFSPEQKSAPLQAKLSVGKPGDKYEQEADRVADQVMGMTLSPVDPDLAAPLQQPAHAPGLQNKPLAITPWVQRQTDNEDDEETALQAKPLIQRQTENEDEEEEKTALQTKSLVQQQVETAEEEEEDKQTLQASATPDQVPVTSDVASGVSAMQGGGQALSAASRAFMEPRFGHDFSKVRIHADSNAAHTSRQINARAFTVGQNIAFGSGQYQPNTLRGRKLLAHELTHVVQQSALSSVDRASPSMTMVQAPTIQRIAPAVVGAVIWFGKALAATSVDALIDFAIAAITGMPPPGFWAHVGNFFINLVPFLGEAKKLKKAAKLFKVVDNIVLIVRCLNKLKVPGSANLLKRMIKEADMFKDAIKAGDLDAAKSVLGRLLGFLREAQVASKLKESGARIVQLGKNIKVGKKVVTEIDTITEESGKLIYSQIKAGRQAILTPGSDKWVKFTTQIDETVKAAKAAGAEVRYFVDDISEEALSYLKNKGVDVKLTGEILK